MRDAIRFQPHPIETAPRDGSIILVFFPVRENGPLALIPAHYDEAGDGWFCGGVDIPAPLHWLPAIDGLSWPPDPLASRPPLPLPEEWAEFALPSLCDQPRQPDPERDHQRKRSGQKE